MRDEPLVEVILLQDLVVIMLTSPQRRCRRITTGALTTREGCLDAFLE